MAHTFSYTFDAPAFKGTSNLESRLFIGGKFVDPVEPATIDIFNPTTGDKLASIPAGSKDVEIAVETAQKAYKSSWGLKVPGAERGRILNKLADLIEQHADELAALESLNVEMTWQFSRHVSVEGAIKAAHYFAGWADKVHGKAMETNELKFAYSRHEPYGVVAMILPWNVPATLTLWKIAPALATGNTMVLEPSELTPLSTLRLCQLINEAGVPPGVVNIINGYEDRAHWQHTHGAKDPQTIGGQHLKNVTLELGGKSPAIIFDDAELEQVVKWVSRAIFINAGQACIAGSRIFVQEGVYDKFIEPFTAAAKATEAAAGDLLRPETLHQPQVSKTQYDVNCAMWFEEAVPFGGYKQSGIGRELGEYALETYTQVKGVHINLGLKL